MNRSFTLPPFWLGLDAQQTLLVLHVYMVLPASLEKRNQLYSLQQAVSQCHTCSVSPAISGPLLAWNISRLLVQLAFAEVES